MNDQEQRRDCAQQLCDQLAEGRISRRRFVQMMGFLGFAVVASRIMPAEAAGTEIVVANFGGDAIKATMACYGEPFMKANPGVTVKVDGSGPTSGRTKAIVQSGKITWDLVDRNFHGSLELGPQGLLEEIDYTIVDASKVLPGYAGKWGVGSYTYANVMSYDTRRLKEKAPTTWADFWNVKDFPGKRTMRKHIDGVIEAALMADGVPMDKVYPIDVKRAFDKIKQIKEHTIFWNSHSESYALLRDGEVSMGILASSRAAPLKRDTRGAVPYTFNQATFFVSGWAVLKGAPSGKKAMEFIAAASDPKMQVQFLRMMGNGPINPAANDLIPPDLAEMNPSHPKNLAVMLKANNEWYAEHSSAVLQRFYDEVVA